MRRRPDLFFTLGLLALLVAIASCAKRETPVEEGLRTKTLLLGNLAEPATLDPHLVNSLTDMNVLMALFEGLTLLDEKTSQPVPGVAEKWDVSADGTVYTFHLRADARWSNGDRVTARDFAFSFERMLSPKLAAEYSYMLWPIKNAKAFNTGTLADFSTVGVKVVDETTLQITLERPTPYLPALAAHNTWLPVHRATLEKFGSIHDRTSRWTNPGNLVGNGPFTLTEWTPNARIVATKNPRYWDAARNGLERVVFFPTENPDTEERNFRAGQTHITYDLPKTKIPGYRAQSPSPLRIDPLLNITYLNFNVTKPPLDDPRVRRALSLAIDRDAIARTVMNNAWVSAHSFTPPGCGSYVAPASVTQNFEEARRLLAEAGHPGGRDLPVLPVQVLNDNNQPRIVEAIQAMWQRELGVRVTIEPYEQKIWLQNQQNKAHTIATLMWNGDFPDPVTFLDILATDNGNNWTNWGDPNYDRLLDAAAKTADAQQRLELLKRAETLMLDAAPVAPLFYKAKSYLIHPAVKNWEPSPLGLHRYQLIRLQP